MEMILSSFHFSCAAQLQVICKHDEGTLDLTVCVTDEDDEEHWSQDRALRDTAHCWPPPRHKAIDHNSLAAFIPYLTANSLSTEPMSLQFGDKKILDHIEGQGEVWIANVFWSSLNNSCHHSNTGHQIGQA